MQIETPRQLLIGPQGFREAFPLDGDDRDEQARRSYSPVFLSVPGILFVCLSMSFTFLRCIRRSCNSLAVLPLFLAPSRAVSSLVSHLSPFAVRIVWAREFRVLGFRVWNIPSFRFLVTSYSCGARKTRNCSSSDEPDRPLGKLRELRA